MFSFIPKSIRGRTFADLTTTYFASPTFRGLSPSSQTPYRRVIERWLRDERLADRSIRSLTREEIERMMATRSPGAANDLLKKIRILTRFAMDRGMLRADPASGVRRYPAGDGHHTWTEAELAQFKQHWPLGTREHLAFSLLLYTGQRRSDVVRMRWEDIAQGRLAVRQAKTRTSLIIPLHPHAMRALEVCTSPRTSTILLTSRGKPFTSAGFGMWIAIRIHQAGLAERCVCHGLRKAAARRLAEAGCSAKEIASVTGHRTLREIERYCEAADQVRLAGAAVARIVEPSAAHTTVACAPHDGG